MPSRRARIVFRFSGARAREDGAYELDLHLTVTREDRLRTRLPPAALLRRRGQRPALSSSFSTVLLITRSASLSALPAVTVTHRLSSFHDVAVESH